MRYPGNQLPTIANNRDDLEVVNGTLWNENVVTSRDITTAPDGSRVLLLQQPYGAIAQLPGWNSGFSVTGAHTLFNAFEFFNEPGTFYFDKTARTLYYYPRRGENMSTAAVEAPITETLTDIEGVSRTKRVENLTFDGLTFANTTYDLHQTANSRGKASVQAATVFTAFADNGDWHVSTYRVLDTLPGVVMLTSASGIELLNSEIKHGGSEGLSLINDVTNVLVEGNAITDIAGSAITVGHPQHVYIGDGGSREKYSPQVEGTPTNIRIRNNFLYDMSIQPGFGGHSGVTAFFPDGLKIENNWIEKTAYNGISLGWGWRNFQDSTVARNNVINNNRLINTLTRLHDSGAIYTLGQMPDTYINENYVRGIPPATSGPTYGLHNDEGSAYMTENDNVLDIDPGVKYTINSEDFGEKHNLTILRTYATVNKMGVTPPQSRIDAPVAVPDNVWPRTQYEICLDSAMSDDYQHLVPTSVAPLAEQLMPASVAIRASEGSLRIRRVPEGHTAWLAPAGATQFSEGATMTRAQAGESEIALPANTGNYRLHVLNQQGGKVSESQFLVRLTQ